MMTVPASDLDDLRREIDRIDDGLLDLLEQRVAVVRQIAERKNDRASGRIAFRPAREAAILRRLVARGAGRLPGPSIVAMWRELLAATTRLQTPFVVAAHVPAGQPGTWDLARDHFGCLTPLLRADSPGHALRLLGDGTAQLAVLPLPDESDLWWRSLVYGKEPGLRIIGRLPFCPTPATQGLAAVIVAPQEPEPSGDDVTLLAIDATVETSRARLAESLARGGLDPRWLAAVREPGQEAALHLIEVDGFMGDREPRLTNALAPVLSQVLRVVAIGGYARPLRAVESPA
jgi:chorismate mutase